MMRIDCPPQTLLRRWLRSAQALCFLGVLAASAARAQDTTSAQSSPWIVGGSVGWLGTTPSSDDRVSMLGLHFTQARAGQLGADLSFAIAPRAIQAGVVLAVARVGVTLPFQPAPALMLLPSAGVSFLGVAADDAGGYAFGYNVGGAALFGTGTIRLRTGVTWHNMRYAERGLWALELGLVNVPGTRIPESTAPNH